MPRLAERPATRAEVVATLAILALAGGVLGARALARRLEGRPSSEDCVALLDRYVELVARAANPSPAASVLEGRKAAALTAAGSRGAARGFARCKTDLTRSEVACALAAPNADEVERCLP